MKTKLTRNLTLALIGIAATHQLHAQNDVITYQGRVQSGGTDFSGTGRFKFALVTSTNLSSTATAAAIMGGVAPNQFVSSCSIMNAGNGYTGPAGVTFSGGGGSGATAIADVSGGVVTNITVLSPGSGYSSAPTVIIDPPLPNVLYVTYWSNDGTSVDGAEPNHAVSVPVNEGLFTVRLGDTSLPNMMALGEGLFQQPDLELRIWFDDEVNGFVVLSPAQPLTAAPYAMDAANATRLTTGTVSDPSFIGTTTSTPLDLSVNNERGLRLEYPTVGSIPNLIGGYDGNSVGAGTEGAVIAGGGSSGFLNTIGADADFSVISGGSYNTIASNTYAATISGGQYNDVGVEADFGTVGGGTANDIQDESPYATIAGGSGNNIGTNADYSTVGGGGVNHIAAGSRDSTIAGGRFNQIRMNASSSVIGGGRNNNVFSDASFGTIGGGYYNLIDSGSTNTTIGGGYENAVNPDSANVTIAGGFHNEIGPNADYSVVGGGRNNSITAGIATVAGGAYNEVGAYYSTVGGGYINQIGSSSWFATIAGGNANHIETDADESAIGGGRINRIEDNSPRATIAGGYLNGIGTNSEYGAIGGGYFNRIGELSSGATVSGGYSNSIAAGSPFSVLGGGSKNSIGADSFNATVGGGYRNHIGNNSDYSVIGGGSDNNIGGDAHYAVVSGGQFNSVADNASYAFAAGHNANAAHPGAFVWSDGGGTTTASAADNSVTMRARGGYRFFTGSGSSGASLAAGATSWTTLSDRNQKKDIQPADCESILEKLAEIPISCWRYEWEKSDSTPHLGPMAQDFKAAFYPGRDETGITTLEADGVALAAIQGLNQKLEQKETEITELKQSVNELRKLVETMSHKLNGGAK